MIAALICIVSMFAFAQFFVFYTRTILISTGSVELSPRVREVMGIADGAITAADFARLLQLLRLCSENPDSQAQIRVVGVYYRLLRFVDLSVRPILPRISGWLEREGRSCSHFAAVALDRRIAHNRSLYGRQIEEGL
jgi:hypothetical protein